MKMTTENIQNKYSDIFIFNSEILNNITTPGAVVSKANANTNTKLITLMHFTRAINLMNSIQLLGNSWGRCLNV